MLIVHTAFNWHMQLCPLSAVTSPLFPALFLQQDCCWVSSSETNVLLLLEAHEVAIKSDIWWIDELVTRESTADTDDVQHSPSLFFCCPFLPSCLVWPWQVVTAKSQQHSVMFFPDSVKLHCGGCNGDEDELVTLKDACVPWQRDIIKIKCCLC